MYLSLLVPLDRWSLAEQALALALSIARRAAEKHVVPFVRPRDRVHQLGGSFAVEVAIKTFSAGRH